MQWAKWLLESSHTLTSLDPFHTHIHACTCAHTHTHMLPPHVFSLNQYTQVNSEVVEDDCFCEQVLALHDKVQC